MARVKLSKEDNKYFTSYFDEDLDMYELFWNAESEHMEDEEYQSLMQEQRDAVIANNYTIEFFLLDNREFLFSMSPDLQEWQANEIFAKMVTKEVKIAVMVSSDFIAQLSIEQAIEEDDNAGETSKYFEDEQEAREWILGL